MRAEWLFIVAFRGDCVRWAEIDGLADEVPDIAFRGGGDDLDWARFRKFED
jgi:hypothetical protein